MRARRPFAACLISGIALAWAAPSAAQCIPGLTCNFSINGKKGRFLEKQVTPEKLAKADAAMSAGLADGRSLDAVSRNRGAFAGTGLSMPLTEQALTAMLARISAVWPHRAPMGTRVRIVGKTDYAPTAKPDGILVIPIGLLIRAQSDDEIAWVLAHEFSHVALAHFSREAQQRRDKASLENIVACTRVGLNLAQHDVTSNAGRLHVTRQENKGLVALSSQVWAKGQIVNTLLEVYNQGLSRDQEDEADAAGIDLSLKAGYSDEGYGTALLTLEQDEKRHATIMQKFGADMTTYAKQAAAQSVQNVAKGEKAGDALSKLLDGFIRNTLSSLLNRGLELVKASHRPAAKRNEGLGKYLDASYGEALPSVATKKSWLESVRSTPEFREAEIAVNARDAALQALEVGVIDPNDPAQVAKLYAGATSAIAKIDMAVHDYSAAERQYDLAAASPRQVPQRASPPAPVTGKRTRGRAPPKPTPPVELPPAPPADPYLQQSLEGFQDHVDLLVMMRNYRKALSIVELAKSRFGDDEAFLPNLITIYVQTRNKEQLLAAVTRCGAVQDSRLSNACNIALIDPAQQEQLALLAPADQAQLMSKIASASADARTGSSCSIFAALREPPKKP